MSDEFIETATKEINEEISELDKILSACQNDANVFSNAAKFQKHTHKIKGLAPMMGKEELGSFSAMLDSILKKMMDGVTIDGIFNVLNDSVSSMKQYMSEPDYNLAEIKIRISQILNNLN
jgi:HPt (histidine-containing phosphotransfer) domain-containing protein